MSNRRGGAMIAVDRAIAIVLIAGTVGGAFGYLFTVHVVASDVEAVWLTTVAFAAVGLALGGVLRS